MTFYSAVLAANVRSARARTDLAQRQLAARMRALGYNWQNSLVAKLEASNRPLLATEVLGLALALETTISDLMTAHPADHPVILPGGYEITSTTVRCLARGARSPVIMWEGEKISTTTERSSP